MVEQLLHVPGVDDDIAGVLVREGSRMRLMPTPHEDDEVIEWDGEEWVQWLEQLQGLLAGEEDDEGRVRAQLRTRHGQLFTKVFEQSLVFIHPSPGPSMALTVTSYPLALAHEIVGRFCTPHLAASTRTAPLGDLLFARRG